MKLRNFFMTVLAGMAILTGCNKEVELGPAKLEVNPVDLAFEAKVSSQDITILATRDWTVTNLPDWIGLSQDTGYGGPQKQSISLTVLENTGFNRSATLVFSIGFDRSTITVTQAGPGGELDNGDGSRNNPFNVAGVLEYIAELGKDVESDKNVFVAGKISAIEEAFAAANGNASFSIITDEESANEQFKVYRALYLGNKKWKEGDKQIAIGDDVILYGKVVNFKGTTPETVQNKAFIYSLNGESAGGVDESDTDPDLEPASDNNVAGLVSRISESATSTDAATVITDFELTAAKVTYVSGSSTFIEDASGAVLIYKSGLGLAPGDIISGKVTASGYYRYGAPQLTNLEGFSKATGAKPEPTEMTIEKLLSTFKSQVSRYIILKGVTVTDAIADGDRKGIISQGEATLDVYAQLNNQGLKMEANATGDFTCFPTYNNATKQVSFYDNALFTANGSGDQPGGDTPVTEETPKGTGTQADPFNPLAARNEALKLEASAITENEFYVKGVISSIKFPFDAEHGTATFNISETGKTTEAQFTCYSVYYYNKAAWVTGNDQVAVGNEVVVCGKFTNYNGTPETANKEGYLVSMKAGSVEPGNDQPTGGEVIIDFSTKGYENQSQHKVTEQDGVTVTFGDGTNDGKYYNTGSAMRIYGNGYVQVSAQKKILKIVYTWDTAQTNEASGAYGMPNDAFPAQPEVGTYDQSTHTWTGEATSVKFTRASGNGHWRLQKVAVTLEGSQGGEQPGGDETPNLPVNDGLTEATAFTVQDAFYVAQHGADASKDYFVKAVVGKDISIKNGMASFELIDGTTSDKLSVVKAKSFGGAAFDGTEPLDWLDEVVMKGKLATLAGSLPILQSGVLVKWNGKSSWTATEPDPQPGTEYAFTTVAGLNALATATATEYTGTLTNAVISYVNGKNAIIKDASGSTLVYKTDHGFKQGQTFTGETKVKVVLYNEAGEITEIDAAFTGNEAVVAPESVSLDAIANDFTKWQSAYVKVSNLEVTAVDAKNISVKDGNTTYVVFSNAGNATCTVGDILTVTGTVCKYKGVGQIKAWAMTDIVAEDPTGGNDPGPGINPDPGTDPTTGGIEFVFDSTTPAAKDGVTVTFAKGEGTTAPAWNTNYSELRLYVKNTVTVASEAKMAKIEYYWHKQGSKTFNSVSMTSTEGTYTDCEESTAATDSKKATWTGSSKSVVLTMGDISSAQRVLEKIVVTLE